MIHEKSGIIKRNWIKYLKIKIILVNYLVPFFFVLKPLFLYIQQKKYFNKARKATIRIPWILIIIHTGAWAIASEIRKLAEKTTTSLKIIGNQVNEMTDDTKNGVIAVNNLKSK
ncbi:MAG: hypothetical protein JXJ04_13020 [Spirochaetales bacterium]|nr:hypothetical protein [Spirochaetales bacterium]